jgi:uncharacterized membrane protein HdeD (DUF308 family)
MNKLGIFWWIFALRGGLALLFALVLYCGASLLGSIFFDPVLFIVLSLLLGSYVLGNSILLGIAGGFALERQHPFGWLLLTECAFTAVLAAYIGHSLFVTAHSLALLAGLHALITGIFQASLAIRLRGSRHCLYALGVCAVISLCVGAAFLTHHTEALAPVAKYLSLYELTYGIVLVILAAFLRKQRAATPESIA